MNKHEDERQGDFTGFGKEWRAASLSPPEARRATDWVEARIDRRSMLTGKNRMDDVRDHMWQLEKEGEIIVHRIGERPPAGRSCGRCSAGRRRSRRPICGSTSRVASAATSPATPPR